MDLVFDGVTLTKAPQSLSMRQKHAAQAIKAMWMKKGEAMSPEVHTYNRYSCVMQSDMNNYLRATWPNHLQESDIAIGWAMLPFSCNSFVICIRRVWGAVGNESSFMGWLQCPWRICSETLDSESKDGQRTMGWSYSCAQVGCLPSKQLSQPQLVKNIWVVFLCFFRDSVTVHLQTIVVKREKVTDNQTDR